MKRTATVVMAVLAIGSVAQARGNVSLRDITKLVELGVEIRQEERLMTMAETQIGKLEQRQQRSRPAGSWNYGEYAKQQQPVVQAQKLEEVLRASQENENRLADEVVRLREEVARKDALVLSLQKQVAEQQKQMAELQSQMAEVIKLLQQQSKPAVQPNQ